MNNRQGQPALTVLQRSKRKVAVTIRAIREALGLHRAPSIQPRDKGYAKFLSETIGLNPRQIRKLAMLAELRNNNLKKTFRRTVANLLGIVPPRITERNLIRNLDFKSVAMEDGLTRLELTNGRIFYGFPSRQKYVNLFYALRDTIPAGFTPETYIAGADAATRYGRGGEYHYLPGQGGVIIEGGAYIGYKAVRMAEIVGPSGRVIAIEIGRRNYELLCKNVQVNGMADIITPLHCGIWKEPGHMEAEFEHANWYHLAAPDEHAVLRHRERVPTDTLDNIIDNQNLEVVDFLNLQLNGAEYEGLLGLDRRFNDVKILRIAAYYTRDGVKQSDVIQEMLRKRGCTILGVGKKNNIVAVTPRYADEFSKRRPRQTQGAA